MKRLFISFAIIFAISNMAMASVMGGYDAGALNSQTMRDLRTHELKTRARQKSAIITTNKQTPLQQRELQEQRDKIINTDIKSITFINNRSIPTQELLNVVSDKINMPMSPENIASIRKSVMQYYQRQGFYSAVAMVNFQDSQTGNVIIEVREGGRNSITIQE